MADVDYDEASYGYIGAAGANVFPGSQPQSVDFIRVTSDFVATVLAVVAGALSGQDALILTAPFLGGGNNPNLGVTPQTSPAANAKVQAITGFASRGGGTTITEWSCILVLDTIDSSQILLYYPRVAADTFGGIDAANLQGVISLQTNELNASFVAMAFDDPLDGETVVRYSAYYPHTNPSISIQN